MLILDEATSNIDITTELQLLMNIFKYTKGKTILIVTHRMTANHLFDKIHILENKVVNASGTHIELLNMSNTYRNMSLESTKIWRQSDDK